MMMSSSMSGIIKQCLMIFNSSGFERVALDASVESLLVCMVLTGVTWCGVFQLGNFFDVVVRLLSTTWLLSVLMSLQTLFYLILSNVANVVSSFRISDVNVLCRRELERKYTMTNRLL